MSKKVTVDFKQPRQFLGIEGVDGLRVYNGLVTDVPAEVINSKAFGLYKEDGSVLVVEGKAEEPKAEVVDEKPKAGK